MTKTRHPLSRQIRILLGIGAFALTLTAFAAFQLGRLQATTFHGTPYPDTPPAPEFQLIDHTGAPASLADFRGSPVLLFFGYTNCPDFCPLTLSRLSRIVADPGAGLEDVQILLVTVDPETDTTDRLARYVAGFGPAVTGLTGEAASLQRVNTQYGVFAEPQTGHDGEPTLAHSTVVFGIDRNGLLQVLIHPEDNEERVLEDIRTLSRIGA